MVEQPKPETANAIRALCSKISVAYDLDVEIQEELRGHMEDKLLAYLNGEEALAEEDALILVREHFGDASKVKDMLQKVHAYESQVSLARRLAAVLVVTTSLALFFDYVIAAVLLSRPNMFTSVAYVGSKALGAGLTVVLSWILLRHWQRRLDAGSTPWFLAWRPIHFAGAIFALSILAMRFSLMKLDATLSLAPPASYRPAVVMNVMSLLIVAMVIVQTLRCVVWLWWCDRPPRAAKAVKTALGMWIVWSLAVSVVLDLGLWTTLAYSSRITLSALGVSVVMSIVMIGGTAVVAFGLYRLAGYIRRRMCPAEMQPIRTS